MNAKIYPLYLLHEVIVGEGERTEEGRALEGIEVVSDPDGYRIEFRGDEGRITLGFHNTYEEDFKDRAARDAFFERAGRLLRENDPKAPPLG